MFLTISRIAPLPSCTWATKFPSVIKRQRQSNSASLIVVFSVSGWRRPQTGGNDRHSLDSRFFFCNHCSQIKV